MVRLEYNPRRRKSIVKDKCKGIQSTIQAAGYRGITKWQTLKLHSFAIGITSYQIYFTTEKAVQPDNFNNEPAVKDHINKLDRLVGKLTPENKSSTNLLRSSLKQYPRNGKLSTYIIVSAFIADGGDVFDQE